MDLYKDIVKKLLASEETCIVFPNIKTDINNAVSMICYNTLIKIIEIIQDDKLEDEECFMKIEKIICELEDIGSNGGNRHDFG